MHKHKSPLAGKLPESGAGVCMERRGKHGCMESDRTGVFKIIQYEHNGRVLRAGCAAVSCRVKEAAENLFLFIVGICFFPAGLSGIGEKPV